ncbi:MAG: cytochrome b/b6 domain-containing protein [Deltaproteobacteria bacterium]|nr:cytochrome b/b6 domain-containing protein [Deltaproteobacteria bacterium]
MENLDENNEIVTVKVWDWQTRVLHWLNAALVISLVLLILGYEGLEALGVEKSAREPLEDMHVYLGRFFVVTLALRIIWGFLGNKYARWSDMIPFSKEKRAALVANLKWFAGGFRTKAPVNVGHNPVASLLYIAVIVVLVMQAVTGLLLAGLEHNMFPGTLITDGLSYEAAEELEEVAEEIHEFGLFFVIFFFASHMAGLVIHRLFDRGGLLGSMLHGKKYFKKDDIDI